MRVLLNIVGTALGVILLAGGMSAAHAEKRRATTSTTTTTKTATPDPNCMSPTLDAAGEGRRAFVRMNCYSCHGGSGHGGTMGPSLVGVEPAEVGEAVLNGEGEGMPSFKNNLCTNDIANLTTYLQTLGTSAEPKFYEWWMANPTQ